MAWYFQSSPHDTHDWDSTQTAVVFDAEFDGKPRKLIAQAARNGHFFVLDRTNGKALISHRVREDQLVDGVRREGAADPEPGEGPAARRRARVAESGRRRQLAVAVVQPADRACSTSTRRAPTASTTSTIRRENPQGWGGTDRGGWSEAMLQAIDYKTGKIRWSHKWEGGSRAGLLSTAGNLIFSGGALERSRRAQRDDG